MIADPNELASLHEEMTRQAHLLEREANVEKPPAGWDGVHCVEEVCGLPVEEGRIAHGFFRCYECQQMKENLIKRFGRTK